MSEEYLTKSWETIRGNIQEILPEMFPNVCTDFVRKKDYAEAAVSLSSQQLAEDITDEIVTMLGYNVLYARCSDDGSTYHVALYSQPYEEEMAVVLMESLQHGIIEEIKVQVFDSLDTMYAHVRHLWAESLFIEGVLLEGAETESEIAVKFF